MISLDAESEIAADFMCTKMKYKRLNNPAAATAAAITNQSIWFLRSVSEEEEAKEKKILRKKSQEFN